MKDLKISVIMAACNQGNYLKETVESAKEGLAGCRNWEIIIIDDHSTDACCDAVEQSERITIHRPENKLGVSSARRLAGAMATGDVIITTDTHCYYPRRSLWRMAHWAIRQRAIIVPAVDMQKGDNYARVEGGELAISSRGVRINRPRIRREFPSLFGSVYVMSRWVWDYLGNWCSLPGYWGGEEQMMSVVAYRLGVPIQVLTHHVCIHRQYRQHARYPFELPAHHVSDIAHYTHATCFPETYDEIWRPMIEEFYHRTMSPGLQPEPLRRWIDERAVWDEHRFFRTVLGTKRLRRHQIIKSALENRKWVA